MEPTLATQGRTYQLAIAPLATQFLTASQGLQCLRNFVIFEFAIHQG